ncbi:hypothetical protein H9655_07955 [Cytobacillus sp. Sa5YUA1]|uniref:Uncharacterized protein n=1 Tax=Cytobacillus stercorigallinarum TaxID=2762240 RepID=A0ABR8QN57_9BACI|nr:hypothetical protein [Cytobacillus stercorigallinarum]MBD7936962.1 hypothetical protein [Cytobacillus stercorigallinarum]
MNHLIMEQLKIYFKGINPDDLVMEQMEFEENVYDILLEDWGESIGSVRMDELGVAEFFIYTDELDEIPGEMSKFAMIMQAEQFIEKFYDSTFRHGLYLSAYIDLGEYHMILYNRKDERLNKELPHSGISFTMLSNGVLSAVERESMDFELVYPKKLITNEEAKQIYLNHLHMVPVIAKYDKDVFVDGDDGYHYVYQLEDFIYGVHTNGEVLTSDSFGVSKTLVTSLPHLADDIDIYTLAGMTEDHMLVAEVKKKSGRLEVWSQLSKESLRVSEEDLLDDELDIPHAIKFVFNSEGRLLKLMGLDDSETVASRHVQSKVALLTATSVLQAIYHNPHDYFKLQQLDDDVINQKPTNGIYDYTFIRQERGVQVADAFVHIQIDDKGLVKYVDVDSEVIQDFSHVSFASTLSFKDATQLIKEKLFMELSWGKNIEKHQYTLTYLPTYPLTTGHIKMIDMNTGEPWIIDTSCMDQY